LISYTLTPADPKKPHAYAAGFRVADLDDVKRLAVGISKFVWSGIIWKDGKRRQDHFLHSDWCVLDFDSPEMSLAEAIRIFCDCRHIIGTTKSHLVNKGGIQCDRFRVAIPWSRRITDLHEYRYNMGRMANAYPIDGQCKDGARYFFPCKEIVSVSEEEYVQEVHAAPPPPPPRRAIQGAMPGLVRYQLTHVLGIGNRNLDCWRISKDLARAGFSADQVISFILQSPTYRENKNPRIQEKIVEAVRGGFNAVKEELNGRGTAREGEGFGRGTEEESAEEGRAEA
jgi:hypothetical protein